MKTGQQKKRLNVDIELNIHCQIKKNAAAQNKKITQWIMEAIADKINREMDLGFN